MSHTYTMYAGSSDEEESSELPPTEGSILTQKWTPEPGLGLTSPDTTRVECSIEINNYTDLTLTKMKTNLKEGGIYKYAQPTETLQPNSRDAFVTHGDAVFDSISISGTHGTASWLIEGKDRRLVIMWSVPRLPIYNNWLAVGFTKPGKTEDISGSNSWFDEMYESSKADGSGILVYSKMADYERTSDNLKKSDESRQNNPIFVCRKSKGLEVRGTIRGRKKVEVKIMLYLSATRMGPNRDK